MEFIGSIDADTMADNSNEGHKLAQYGLCMDYPTRPKNKHLEFNHRQSTSHLVIPRVKLPTGQDLELLLILLVSVKGSKLPLFHVQQISEVCGF